MDTRLKPFSKTNKKQCLSPEIINLFNLILTTLKISEAEAYNTNQLEVEKIKNKNQNAIQTTTSPKHQMKKCQ